MYSVVEPRLKTMAKLGLSTPNSVGTETPSDCSDSSLPSDSSCTSDSSTHNFISPAPVRTPVMMHPARRALMRRDPSDGFRSVSFDESREQLSPIPDHTDGRTSRQSNVSMDKISTMTLTEFKSLLSSALTVPEEQKQSDSKTLNWDSLREKAKSVRDSISTSANRKHLSGGNDGSSTDSISGRRSLPPSPMVERNPVDNRPSSVIGDRPKTPVALRRNYNNPTPGTPPLSRPKTPTSVPSRPKTPTGRPKTPSAENGTREEYKMSRPKTPSQIKRDAVAKVAGAISNWVESRNDMDASHQRPKTPTRQRPVSRPFTPGSFRNELNDDDDNDEIVGMLGNDIPIPSSIKERPETPSRIPKPCFTPRPVTPKTPLSHNHTVSDQRSTPLNTLSRSSSVNSSVYDVQTPSSDVSDRSFASSVSKSSKSKVIGVISRRQPSPSAGSNGQSMNGETNTRSKTYKDIHTTRRAVTPNPGNSTSGINKPPISRSITPGPYDRRNIPDNNSNNISSRGSCSPIVSRRAPLTKQQSLGKNVGVKGQSSPAPVRRASSFADVNDQQEFMLTNEITFSDDEEINELVMNAAKLKAAQAADNRVRSSSVDARKLIRKNTKENDQDCDILMIKRDSSGNHGVQVVKQNQVKYDSSRIAAIKRPPSRGSSTERQIATNVSRFRSQTPDPSMYRQKKNTNRVKDCDDADINRTEAWVDSTLSDNKRKPPMRQKRGLNIGKDIPASELKPRPLEELTALLSEPPNEIPNLDTEDLDAPPEDPEMFRKMERLFEKYREMELRASVNETPGVGSNENAPHKTGSQKSSNSPSTPSLASMRTTSCSHSSSSGRSTQASISNGVASSSNNAKLPHSYNQFHRSPSVPGSFQLSLHQKTKSFSNAGSAATTPSNEIKSFLQRNDRRSQSPASDPASLDSIDQNLAKDPAALVSKIKEILKVNPRKDENPKIPTRIPAPSSLSTKTRSKSVTNLFSDDSLKSANKNTLSTADQDASRLTRTNSSSHGNIAYSELVYSDEVTDDIGEMTQWSVASDSSDGNSRSETPVPKLATPLITGRSTIINRVVRRTSQEKENYLSNSMSSASSKSVLSATEDEGEYV